MAIIEVEMKPIKKKADVDRLFETVKKTCISEEAKKRSAECLKNSGSLAKKK